MRRFLVCFIWMIAVLGVRAEGIFTEHVGEVENGYDYILYEPGNVAINSDALDSIVVDSVAVDSVVVDSVAVDSVAVDCVNHADGLPLIVTLHSRSASGRNLADVDMFGTIDALHSGMELDAVVLAPQATGDSWDVEKIMNDVDRVVATCNIDPNRIYAIGMSMGGNGVAELAAACPDRFAAAIILAGSLTKGDVANLNKLPLWVIRGLNDREEAIAHTDKMVNRMRAQPDKAPRLVYSRVKGVDHRQHERMLYMPYFYHWLMSHSLDNPDRSVNTTMDITAKQLKNAYKGLHLRDGSAALRKSRPRGPRGPRGPHRW